MDDGFTAFRNRSGSRLPLSVLTPVRRRSMLPHHRRRRAAGLGVVAVLAALVGTLLVWGDGGPAARHVGARSSSGGFFAGIRSLAGGGHRSFASFEQAAENGAINRTLAYTPYVRVAGAQHREIALTFDDGPGPYTPQILSILGREKVPATFFEIGVLERYFHASTSQIVEHGYTIGDHTFGHVLISRLRPPDQRRQLLREAAVIRSYGAPFPRLFRPPYGQWNAKTLGLLKRYRMLMVLWTVDTGDYRRPGVRAIVRSALSGARPGAIILMHDAGGNRAQTVAALPKIIAALRKRGYRFVTVPRLLLDNPAPANQRISAVVGGGG